MNINYTYSELPSLSLEELRWNKIKGHVAKAKEKFNSNWMLVLPSTEIGYFHLLELPFCAGNYNDSFKDTSTVYDLLKEDEQLDEQLFKVLGMIMNMQTKAVSSNQLGDMLWFIVHYFTNKEESPVSVYKEERVTFVDFNMQPATVH